jgi:23S rRNA (pseudouridine1915-N3)-methyltransferase
MDEKGVEFTSTQFAAYINKKEISTSANLIFIIGGPYGFDHFRLPTG